MLEGVAHVVLVGRCGWSSVVKWVLIALHNPQKHVLSCSGAASAANERTPDRTDSLDDSWRHAVGRRQANDHRC